MENNELDAQTLRVLELDRPLHDLRAIENSAYCLLTQ